MADRAVPQVNQVAHLATRATKHVRSTTLRHVATDMLMTPGMLDAFLAGASPPGSSRTPTGSLSQRVRKVEGSTDPHAQECARIILDLVSGLPARQRSSGAAALLRVLEAQFAEDGRTPPEWLRQLISTPG